jgi:ubiquinone/menaquinone biosynthesis C-methylase UbiE
MRKCPSCGHTKFINYRYVSKYLLLMCVNCDLVITKATNRQIDTYVSAKYSQKYAKDYIKVLPKLYRRFNYQINEIKKYNKSGKLMDIGCGTGHFLEYIKINHPNWQIYGVEPSKLLRTVARKNTKGDIRNGQLAKIPFKDNYFDIVTCYDVLEHNINLSKNIRELHRVIKPGGILFIQAPNYASLMSKVCDEKWDWWCIPDHIFHFSYNFLTKYMSENGFRILKKYTYEDKEDFLSNIKGVYAKNYLTKAIFMLLTPLLLISERVSWLFNQGGLQVLVLEKRKI